MDHDTPKEKGPIMKRVLAVLLVFTAMAYADAADSPSVDVVQLKAEVKLFKTMAKRQSEEIKLLQAEVERLRALCKENGIDPDTKPETGKPVAQAATGDARVRFARICTTLGARAKQIKSLGTVAQKSKFWDDLRKELREELAVGETALTYTVSDVTYSGAIGGMRPLGDSGGSYAYISVDGPAEVSRVPGILTASAHSGLRFGMYCGRIRVAVSRTAATSIRKGDRLVLRGRLAVGPPDADGPMIALLEFTALGLRTNYVSRIYITDYTCSVRGMTLKAP